MKGRVAPSAARRSTASAPERGTSGCEACRKLSKVIAARGSRAGRVPLREAIFQGRAGGGVGAGVRGRGAPSPLRRLGGLNGTVRPYGRAASAQAPRGRPPPATRVAANTAPGGRLQIFIASSRGGYVWRCGRRPGMRVRGRRGGTPC